MNKLELKDIFHYLPYGVHLMNKFGNWHHKSTDGYWNMQEILYYKPVLYPLSMFKEEKTKDLMFKFDCSSDVIQDILKFYQEDIKLKNLNYKIYSFMCKNHIDFNNLIRKELAVNRNNLK